MIKEIVTDPIFLSQKSEPATKSDQQTIRDLLDTKDVCPCRDSVLQSVILLL